MSDEGSDESLVDLSEFTIDRFVDVRPIGQGRNAMVFWAWDTHLEREVALKTSMHEAVLDSLGSAALGISELDPGMREAIEMLEADAEANRRYSLLREARVLAQIDHPNVVSVLEVGLLEADDVAVVLPYLGGGTLHEKVLHDPWEDVLELALQIGRGLEAIHAVGLLHRDLKPNNILLGADGRPRIADLGLACRADDAELMADWVGTRDYMAPEVLDMRLRDVRDDLYAFCVVVYEMFYAHGPFSSLEARKAGDVRPAVRQQGMSEGLHEIITRGLAPDPDERWPDMPTLLQAMENVRAPRARRRWPWLAAGFAAAAALGVLAVRPALADECEEVAQELAPIFDNEVQAELRGAYGTRKVGDAMKRWAARWVAARAQECEAAKRDERAIELSPCSASTRARFEATLRALRTPHLREGLHWGLVMAQLPDPEHCVDHPEDDEWGNGGLLELWNLDIEIDASVKMGDLELAKQQQQRYMRLSDEQRYEYGVARAMFWRGEIRRVEGELDVAAEIFERAYARAQELQDHVFEAEVLMKLTAVAGARGDVSVADLSGHLGRAVFQAHAPRRVPEMLQVHGLALLSGPTELRSRGVALLREAVEMREDQLLGGGSRERLSQAYESYARGLLAVGRPEEALDYIERAHSEHEAEFGHGTWRTRDLLRVKFQAQLRLRHFDAAKTTDWTLLDFNRSQANWNDYVQDAYWLAEEYIAAGEPRRALWPLRAGRSRAEEHRLSTEVVRFDAALEELMSK